MDDQRDDKTPILLHPAKRAELLRKGQQFFNDELYFEAHEAWEELWNVENGRDRLFVQGLIQIAAHYVHVRKGNWSGARSVAGLALDKLRNPPLNRIYRELDITALTSAIEYNLGLLGGLRPNIPPPVPDAFLFAKLFEP